MIARQEIAEVLQIPAALDRLNAELRVENGKFDT